MRKTWEITQYIKKQKGKDKHEKIWDKYWIIMRKTKKTWKKYKMHKKRMNKNKKHEKSMWKIKSIWKVWEKNERMRKESENT